MLVLWGLTSSAYSLEPGTDGIHPTVSEDMAHVFHDGACSNYCAVIVFDLEIGDAATHCGD
ncbi:MAG: hypothetical protein ACE5JA_02645 [bacterium]